MACPLYYLPGQTRETLTPERLRMAGLGDVFADCLDSHRAWDARLALRQIVDRGPDNGRGMLVAAHPATQPAQHIGHYAAHQTWRELDGGIWFGVDRRFPVTPEDLRRPQSLEGHDTVLGEHVWTVPILRRGGIRPALPQALIRRNGRLELQLRAEWQETWRVAGRCWDLLTTVQGAEWEEVYDLCRHVLGVNYRVGDAELELLAPFDTATFSEVFKAACDWPLVEQLLTGQHPGEDLSTPHPPEAAPAAA